MRLHLRKQALANANGAIFVKSGMVAERAQEQLKRFRFDDRRIWRIVDNQMREIRLGRYRTQGCEFRHGKAREIQRVWARVGDIIQLRLFRRLRKRALRTKKFWL